MTPATSEGAAPPRLTRGFVAFIGVMCLPAVAALGVFLGAWAVSGEVYAAEDARTAGASATMHGGEGDVAGWKQTLVGICPIH